MLFDAVVRKKTEHLLVFSFSMFTYSLYRLLAAVVFIFVGLDTCSMDVFTGPKNVLAVLYIYMVFKCFDLMFLKFSLVVLFRVVTCPLQKCFMKCFMKCFTKSIETLHEMVDRHWPLRRPVRILSQKLGGPAHNPIELIQYVMCVSLAVKQLSSAGKHASRLHEA